MIQLIKTGQPIVSEESHQKEKPVPAKSTKAEEEGDLQCS